MRHREKLPLRRSTTELHHQLNLLCKCLSTERKTGLLGLTCCCHQFAVMRMYWALNRSRALFYKTGSNLIVLIEARGFYSRIYVGVSRVWNGRERQWWMVWWWWQMMNEVDGTYQILNTQKSTSDYKSSSSLFNFQLYMPSKLSDTKNSIFITSTNY